MKKLRIRRSLSIVGLLAVLLVVDFSQVQAFHEKDLKTHLERFENESSTQGLKAYHKWSQENLYSPFALAYMKLEALKYWTVVFALGAATNEDQVSVSDRAKLNKCGYDVMDMEIQALRNEDPAARAALIKKYAARYEECMNFGDNLAEKVQAKQKAVQEKLAEQEKDKNNK